MCANRINLDEEMEWKNATMTLLTHRSPLQAIVASFGFDERTVATRQGQAGERDIKSTRAIAAKDRMTPATSPWLGGSGPAIPNHVWSRVVSLPGRAGEQAKGGRRCRRG